jgi:hypothetical protein
VERDFENFGDTFFGEGSGNDKINSGGEMISILEMPILSLAVLVLETIR